MDARGGGAAGENRRTEKRRPGRRLARRRAQRERARQARKTRGAKEGANRFNWKAGVRGPPPPLGKELAEQIARRQG